MSAVCILISKFTKNTVNDTDAITEPSINEKAPDDNGFNSSALHLPECAPPKTLTSRTVDLFIGFPVGALDAKGQFNAVNIPLDNLGSTEKNGTSPLHQQEVSLLAPNPGLSPSTPANNPNAGSPTPPTIYGEISTSFKYPTASSGGANNKDTQELQQDATSNNLEDNQAKVTATISILFQDIQPQRILSINATLCSAESTPPLETLAPNNTDEAAQEPQMTVYDLNSSIRAVLSESHCEVHYLDAVEITGSPECFPFIQETLRGVLSNTHQERIKFSWDKLGDTDAGHREVFLKDQLSLTTQVLILHRHSDFSINLHRGASTDDSPNIIWYITGLGNKTSPATVKLVYQLYPSGYCDNHPAGTIIGPSRPTEQDTSAGKTFIDQRKLDVRYSLIRSSSITAEDLLLGFVETPTLWDKTGKREALQPSLYEESIETACLFAFIPQLVCTILYFCLMNSITMYEVLVAVTATLALPFLIRLLVIMSPWGKIRLVGYLESDKLALAGYVSFLIAIPPLMCSVHDWQQSTSAIVSLCIHVVSAAAFFAPTLCVLPFIDQNAYYGNYLELGAVLDAESYFPKLFADSNEPRQSIAEKQCLKHYRRCEVLELLKSYDTDKNQNFWREMGILRRIPYALIPGSDNCHDELSLKCPRKDMTRAEAFKFVVTRKRKLCDRLGISTADTDEEIKKRFSLIRDPDSKLLLI